MSERPPTALEIAISEAEADRGEARSRRVADDLRARLQVGQRITSWVDKDQALASVAKDAAQEGEVEIVRAALNGITGWATKDDAAAESAQRLAAAGMHTHALEMARLMTSWSKRDEILRALSAMTLPVAGGTRRREHAVRDELATRYAAAAAITSFGTKDIAMAALARDAARGGNVEIVKKALASISSFSTKDEAAVGAAQELAKVGLRAEALEITRVISSFSKRDAILRELTEGKPDRHN